MKHKRGRGGGFSSGDVRQLRKDRARYLKGREIVWDEFFVLLGEGSKVASKKKKKAVGGQEKKSVIWGGGEKKRFYVHYRKEEKDKRNRRAKRSLALPENKAKGGYKLGKKRRGSTRGVGGGSAKKT